MFWHTSPSVYIGQTATVYELNAEPAAFAVIGWDADFIFTGAPILEVPPTPVERWQKQLPVTGTGTLWDDGATRWDVGPGFETLWDGSFAQWVKQEPIP